MPGLTETITIWDAAGKAVGESVDRLPLIRQHLQALLTYERKQWDEARAWLQGRFWQQNTGESEWKLVKTSSNITFALVETAIASMVPRHPQITCQPRLPMEPDAVLSRERYVNMALDASRFRRELQMSVQDCVLCGRSVYKTTWSEKLNRPQVRAIDPRSIIFDLTARRVEDIRYWCEVTVLSKQEFDDRVTRGFYVIPPGKSAPEGDAYPTWLQDSDQVGGDAAAASNSTAGGYRKLQDWQPWITIYEWYDVDSKRVQHWHANFDQPLYDAPCDYIPYTLYFLNSNGQDCRGLSEILLVKPNIDATNRLLSYMMMLVRLQIPRILYDAGAITEEEVSAIQSAEPGAWVPLILKNAALIASIFTASPVPTIPPEVNALLAKEESIIAYVSAMAEAARGQVTGARTATELALIEGQLRTRLQARQANVDDATADVARKMLWLAGQKLKEPVWVRIGQQPDGTPTFAQLLPHQLADIDIEFDVVPYTPLDNNRAVVEERFLAQLPIIAARPNVDQALLNEDIARVLRLNPKLFQAQQPQQQPGVPAAPGGPGPMDGPVPSAAAQVETGRQMAEVAAIARNGKPSTLPPQMAAKSNAVAAPATAPVAGVSANPGDPNARL